MGEGAGPVVGAAALALALALALIVCKGFRMSSRHCVCLVRMMTLLRMKQHTDSVVAAGVLAVGLCSMMRHCPGWHCPWWRGVSHFGRQRGKKMRETKKRRKKEKGVRHWRCLCVARAFAQRPRPECGYSYHARYSPNPSLLLSVFKTRCSLSPQSHTNDCLYVFFVSPDDNLGNPYRNE